MLISSKNKIIYAIIIVSIGILSFANKSEEKGKINSSVEKAENKVRKEFLSKSIFKENKVVIINFWASWCIPCLTEMPSLNRLYDLKKEEGLMVIGVNSDYEEQKKLIKKIKKQYNITYPLEEDKNGKLVDAFAVLGLPTTFIVRNGLVIETIKGEFNFDSSEFLKKLSNLLKD
tara:strand:+ start:604 stop:1125 length:522 start_codon:yes stop_codon:yes gene_type:complete